MDFKEFEVKVRAAGLQPRDCGNGHWRIEGGKFEVNWWPNSRRKTIYINGLSRGNITKYGNCETAIAAATEDPDIKHPDKRGGRKKGYRREKRALHRADPNCYWCREPLKLEVSTIDHKIPLMRGGSNATDNLVLSCDDCNKKKGNDLWTDLPKCFGSNPSYQAQAENDCRTCKMESKCLSIEIAEEVPVTTPAVGQMA